MEFFGIYLNLLPVSLTQGAIYAFAAMSVMIPFRILSLPDLTSEGTFPLGGAVAASVLASGYSPALAIAAAIFCGVLAGGLTAASHLLLRIPSLLAGIIVLTMLFSINIRVMGKPNTAIFDVDTAFTLLLGSDGGSVMSQFSLVFVMVAMLCAALYWFLRTEVGIAIRTVGANQTMARAQGLSVTIYILGGLGLAGALAATGGAVMAQYQSYADVNMGVGVLIIGLASTILGESVIGRKTLLLQILAPVAGSLLYFQVVAIALAFGMNPSDLKLLTGLFVLVTLAIPILASRFRRST